MNLRRGVTSHGTKVFTAVWDILTFAMSPKRPAALTNFSQGNRDGRDDDRSAERRQDILAARLIGELQSFLMGDLSRAADLCQMFFSLQGGEFTIE